MMGKKRIKKYTNKEKMSGQTAEDILQAYDKQTTPVICEHFDECKDCGKRHIRPSEYFHIRYCEKCKNCKLWWTEHCDICSICVPKGYQHISSLTNGCICMPRKKN